MHSGITTKMASRLPRVHVLTNTPGLFQAVKNALPNSDVVDITVPGPSDTLKSEEMTALLEAEILLTDLSIIQKHDLFYLPKLKWMQSNWAGVDGYMKALDKTKPYPTYHLTRAGSCYGPHMAEYALAQMISHERNFPAMAIDQQNKQWNGKKYHNYRLLSELTLGILGLGAIGRDVAKAAKCMGMTVWGLGTREGSPRNPCAHVDEYRGPSGLSELLAASDYICNILPSTPATRGLLSGDVLSCCTPKRPVLINYGRGDIISEDTVIKALSEGWLRAAVLDVFIKEPLPESSPLWTHPAVTITPHVAGVSLAWQITDFFVDNYKRYVDGEPLENEVNWDAGY